jgi:tetratricopeptide (TPR) repeat protein/tRNA A-37 threonylcarbamoyl transferase component Bud32
MSRADQGSAIPSAPSSPATTVDESRGASPPSTGYPEPSLALRNAGRYRPLRFHARGGLGEVFIAEDTELHREVALKEIQQRHVHDGRSRARFLMEAEITGRLEHPGVVPVYGLGSRDDGRPYYAMRFIRGDSLKDAIERFHAVKDQNLLSGERSVEFRKLLGRFIDVCNAIAYAHSRGVLHRDLKPGNVMLGEFGETLVVDWGLAKILSALPAADVNPPSDDVTLPLSFGSDRVETVSGAAVGTPAYMSPEQADGKLDQLGPATDVYGLGATLYCLLTGQSTVQGQDKNDALDRARRGDIAPPSEVRPDVPKALSAICMKALALRPADRYETPLTLAADLEHWLADEPVSAYGDPVLVRAARWARKHKPVVATAAAVLLTATVGLAAGMFYVKAEKDRTELARQGEQRQRTVAEANAERAEAAFAKAKEAVDKYLKEVAEDRQLKDTPGLHDLRKRLLTAAVPFFTWFTEQRPTEPRLRADQGWAFGRLASLQEELGDDSSALANRERHREICAQLVANYPEDATYQSDLGGALHNLATFLHREGVLDKARTLYEEAIGHAQIAVQAEPSNAMFRLHLSNHKHNLGALLAATDRLREAETAYGDALAIRRQLATDFPHGLEFRRVLAGSYLNMGALLSDTARPHEAESAYGEGLAIFKELVAEFPHQAEYRNELAGTFGNLAILHSERGEFRLAKANLEEAQQHHEVALKVNPQHPSYRQFYFIDLLALVSANAGLLDQPGATRAAEKIRDLGWDPASDALGAALALARCIPVVSGHDQLDARQRHSAVEFYGDQAMAMLRDAVAKGFNLREHRELMMQKGLEPLHSRDDFKKLLAELEGSYTNLGRHADAVKLHEETLALKKAKLGPDHPDTLASMDNLATSYAAVGRYADALKLYEETLQLCKAKLGPDHPNTLATMNNLSTSYAAVGRYASAVKLNEETLALMKAKLGPDHRDTLGSMNNLASSYDDLGRHADAVKLHEETLALRKAKLGPDHPHTLISMNNLANSYAKLGRQADALKLHKETLALRKANLGPDHPDTLQSMYNLANSYADLGRHAEALKLAEETLALQKAKLGPDHPDTLSTMHNLAHSYSALGRQADALKLHKETLALRKANLGPDHPDTLQSMYNLANSYADLGRHAEALKLAEETLALQKAKLGPDHPDTLSTMHNLAHSYSALGRHADALKLREETLGLQKAKLGLDHPDTLLSMGMLAGSLSQVDRGAEAVPIIDECVRRAAGKVVEPVLIPGVMDLRLRHFEKSKDSTGCRATAEMWEKLNRTDADSLYTGACMRAVTAAVVWVDPKTPGADATRLAKVEADKAMDWLRRAVAAGYKDVEHMRKEVDLGALRGREDFKMLLAELEAGKEKEKK